MPETLSITKEIPILFGPEMVRAILDRGKCQTRRLLKPKTATQNRINPGHSRYGRPGDRLWVRETWYRNQVTGEVLFRADRKDPTEPPVIAPIADVARAKWIPSIYMPREACRIELEIIAVRTEPVQNLTAADAIDEGIHRAGEGYWSWGGNETHVTPRLCYAELWDRINPGHPWDTNPGVLVITFKRRESLAMSPSPRGRCGYPEIHPITGLTLAQTTMLANLGAGRPMSHGTATARDRSGHYSVFQALVSRGLANNRKQLTAKGRVLFEALLAGEGE